ncbi:hypothetical protein HELRODRAFT_181308 [Helobdella robusta]|uniref:Calponin-homology (CH) domain-containing protein n=1 Tax=Helobdella robusta TaxID=6412 RepID=T1FGV8_HELRO|nr:hypothetical protein HELRODRAFT_181308 [Helobdella robusta]ESN92439.1 hypothetical protein HELRODRAFT_181308 [Helobdella robusta]
MALRAGKVGDALELEMKRQRRYEKEEELGLPQNIAEWITRVVDINVTPPASQFVISKLFNLLFRYNRVFRGIKQGGVFDYRTIHSMLKDGAVLCKLMNRLHEHDHLPKLSFRNNVKSSFVAIANIDTFCIAARNYGVPDNCLFQSTDLYEGRKGQMLSVLNCLDQLGKIANNRGFFPFYQVILPPKPDHD